MKRILAILLSVMLGTSFLIIGCSSENEKETKSENTTTASEGEKEDQLEQTTLRVVWWGSQTRHDKTLEAIKLYEEKNPNVKVEPEFMGWEGYWEKLAAQIAGNNAPDVIQHDYAKIGQYVSRGVLEDLDGYVGNELNLDNVNEGILAAGTVDGKLYGISLGTNAPGILYDPEMFEKAGVELPKDKVWTWDEFTAAATQVHEKLDVYGVDPLPTYHGFNLYLRQHDKHLYSQDGTKLGYEEDQLFVDYFTMKLNLQEAGVSPTPDIIQQVKGIEDSLLVHGKMAMNFPFSNQLFAISSAAKRSLEFTLFPVTGTKTGLYLKPSMLFTVAKSSEAKSEAVKFINYFTNDLDANRILMAERGVPISSVVREGLAPELDEAQTKTFEYINLVEQHSTVIDPPEPSSGPEVMSLLEDDIDQRIMYKQITPEEGAKLFREKATEILKRQ